MEIQCLFAVHAARRWVHIKWGKNWERCFMVQWSLWNLTGSGALSFRCNRLRENSCCRRRPALEEQTTMQMLIVTRHPMFAVRS